jgi:hypothetical protein
MTGRATASTLTVALVLAAGGCQSTAEGSGGSGGAPQGVGSCSEEPAGTDPTALTIEKHRVVARMNIGCIGNVTPDAYYFQMILWKNGIAGPGVEYTKVPGFVPMSVSTACAQGTYHVRFVVTGKWPDGSPLKASKDQTSADLPAKEVRLDDC